MLGHSIDCQHFMEPEGSIPNSLFLSLARPIQSISPHSASPRSILILSTHLRLGLPSGLFPSGLNCDYRFFKLRNTFWITLHISNQWLFVTPRVETFTDLCPQETTTLKLYNEGRLTLRNECKGYSSYATLHAMSITVMNVASDCEPSAPINFEHCFEDIKSVNFENSWLQIWRPGFDSQHYKEKKVVGLERGPSTQTREYN
jgi:hypothetical protein